ncbi:hypothetical protein X975_17386, partial [Stegodyphus mimosarum]
SHFLFFCVFYFTVRWLDDSTLPRRFQTLPGKGKVCLKVLFVEEVFTKRIIYCSFHFSLFHFKLEALILKDKQLILWP